MLRCPGMPMLPGTEFRDVTKTRFHKSQHWNHLNGVPLLTERKDVSFGGDTTYNPENGPHLPPPLYPVNEGPKVPSWLAFDKQVLCFYGYFQETLQDVYKAPYLIRNVKIYYYLEDGTIKISEPPIPNSGIPQGCLLSRQRVPRVSPCRNEYITILDLNVNQTVKIYDKNFHITGCDPYTRKFLNRAGISVPDSIDSPPDPGTEIRLKCAINSHPKRVVENIDTFGQFLKYDRKVLRFFGYWDDQSEFGDLRELEIFFYLADDTIEIKEIFPHNSGRIGPSVFLKRQRLVKEWSGLPQPGEEARLTILNVLGKGLRGGRYIADTLGVGKQRSEYYKADDLQIGSHLNVYARDVILTDCDGFTKDYYKAKFGIESFTPLFVPKQLPKPLVHLRDRDLPPFNGWGTHEDSEGNCITVEPKPPHIDFKKFVNLDRLILRFGARLISKIKENNERIFTISYYLSDDTVSVFEVPMRNSGFSGGEFFKRDVFLLPNQALLTPRRPERYKPYHFFVGATLELKYHNFYIESADEFTLNYMETHPFEFPFADIETIMAKIREVLRPNYKTFISQYLSNVETVCVNEVTSSFANSDVIRKALMDLLGSNINDHEIVTVCRYFSAEGHDPDACNRETIRGFIHWEINRALWDALPRLKEHIFHFDPERYGFLPESAIRSLIIGCRLPFKKELIENLFKVLHRNADGYIEVADFVNIIDTTNPAPAVPPIHLAFELNPNSLRTTKTGCIVDWDRFLDKIGLEAELKQQTD